MNNAEIPLMQRTEATSEGPLPGDTVVHRIGGGAAPNLRPRPDEAALNPPGISVLAGGSHAAIAAQIRAAFPVAQRLHEQVNVIGSATVDAIRGAGFDVIPNPTRKLPNHARLTHPEGASGFTDENLRRLERAFDDSRLD